MIRLPHYNNFLPNECETTFFEAVTHERGCRAEEIPCALTAQSVLFGMAGRKMMIGSRGSDLALFQAGIVQSALRERCGREADIKVIKTQGDRVDTLSFDKMEGKGFFTKELEEALLDGTIDLAVHSLKDLPTTQPAGLRIGAVGFRADRRELLLVTEPALAGAGVLPVRPGALIGTSSARRKAQIAYHNPELEIRDLRGNVPTRIKKLRDGQYDAIVIAAAGAQRLGLDLSGLETIHLGLEDFLPAPAQGVLAIEIRDDHDETAPLMASLNSSQVEQEVALERGLLRRFNAGCSLPLGVYAEITRSGMRLAAVLGLKERDRHTGLKRVDVTARTSEEAIATAYDALTDGL